MKIKHILIFICFIVSQFCKGGGGKDGEIEEGDYLEEFEMQETFKETTILKLNGEICSPVSKFRSGVESKFLSNPEIFSAIAEKTGLIPVDGGEKFGKYIFYKNNFQDCVYIFESGRVAVASFCEIEDIGQIRRLDFALLESSKIIAVVKSGISYEEKAIIWTEPLIYFSPNEGIYQRFYFNSSLNLNDPHEGTLILPSKVLDSAFNIYGHTDEPSLKGDIVGIELLKINGVLITKDDRTTGKNEVMRAWEIKDYLHGGSNGISVDLIITDASSDLNVGKYWVFIDAVIPPQIKGVMTFTIDGAPPGKSLISSQITKINLPACE